MVAAIEHMSWDAVSAGTGLVLRLERGVFVLHDRGVTISGTHFVPKRELHITLLGSSQLRALREHGMDAVALRSTVAQLDWCWRPCSEAWRLRRVRGGVVTESLIVLIDMPAQTRLRRVLAATCGIDFGEPVPHVTLYTHAEARGIGLNNREMFEQLRVAPVAIECLVIAN